MIGEMALYWLAGLLEGEGSFLPGEPSNPNSPRISLVMTDFDVVRRAADLLGVQSIYTRQGKGSWQTSYGFHLKGTRAIAAMRQLQPLMGARRQSQIDRALASHHPHHRSFAQSKLTEQQVLEIYRRAHQGESLRDIAADLKVSYNACSDIKRGHSWTWLTGHDRRQEASTGKKKKRST
jgi:hypothetical protein